MIWPRSATQHAACLLAGWLTLALAGAAAGQAADPQARAALVQFQHAYVAEDETGESWTIGNDSIAMRVGQGASGSIAVLAPRTALQRAFAGIPSQLARPDVSQRHDPADTGASRASLSAAPEPRNDRGRGPARARVRGSSRIVSASPGSMPVRQPRQQSRRGPSLKRRARAPRSRSRTSASGRCRCRPGTSAGSRRADDAEPLHDPPRDPGQPRVVRARLDRLVPRSWQCRSSGSPGSRVTSSAG